MMSIERCEAVMGKAKSAYNVLSAPMALIFLAMLAFPVAAQPGSKLEIVPQMTIRARKLSWVITVSWMSPPTLSK